RRSACARRCGRRWPRSGPWAGAWTSAARPPRKPSSGLSFLPRMLPPGPCSRSRLTRGCEMDWLKAAQQLRDEGQPGVLVTVAEVRGHAPREAGAKMVVGRERIWGSVGGGNLEATAVARAREMIGSGTAEPAMHEARLNPHARNEHGRQCCGGVVRLLLEPLPVRPVVALFGVTRRLRARPYPVPAADPAPAGR